MFQAIILPIFRCTRLCVVTACGIMNPRCCRPPAATSGVHYTTSCNTQSSAPEDGQNNCPKHVELTGIINKPLLLHLAGCLYYLYQWCMVKQISDNEIYLLIKYIKSVLWRAVKCLSLYTGRTVRKGYTKLMNLQLNTEADAQPGGSSAEIKTGTGCHINITFLWKLWKNIILHYLQTNSAWNGILF